MKRILSYFLCFCILCLGGFYLLSNGNQSQQSLQVQSNLNSQVAQSNGIQIITQMPVLRRGETGILALKCAPNVNCTIVCNYKISGLYYCATRNLVAGNDGSVFCTWKVNTQTDIGTYQIQITSGGARLVTSYIVQ